MSMEYLYSGNNFISLTKENNYEREKRRQKLYKLNIKGSASDFDTFTVKSQSQCQNYLNQIQMTIDIIPFFTRP